MDRSRHSTSAAQGATAAADCRGCGAAFEPAVTEQVLCDGCQGLIAPEAEFPAQEEVAGYRLVRRMGGGRFSTAWLAESPAGVAMVLKLLRPEVLGALALPRFLAESERLVRGAAPDSEGIARLVEAGAPAGGPPFLAYESGGELTLADELRAQGQVILPRALALCAQVAEALDTLHGAGVLHLDLKPANVGLAGGPDGERAVLLDALTSHLLGHPAVGDGSSLPLSTAAYLSPEQARGETPGAAADFYALGVLLYQLVTGGLPVYGSTSAELFAAHRDQPPLRLRDGGSRVDPALEAALARMLAKDPALRYPSGAVLAAELRALALEPENHELGLAPAALPPEPAWSSSPAGGAKLSALAGGADLTYGPRAPPDIEEALARAMLDGTLPRPARAGFWPIFRRRAEGFRWPRWASPARVTPLLFALLLAGSATLAVRAARTPSGPNLALAQTLLDQGETAGAKRAAQAVLVTPDLSAPDRAQATLLMAAAHDAAGEKQAAIAWYRRYLRVGKDPHDRARAARRIHALSR